MNLNLILEKWYNKYPSITPHPALGVHDTLHAILDEPPNWEGEIKVGVLDYTYNCLVRGNSLTIEGAREFLQTVIKEVIEFSPEAHDFLTESELCSRISASVRILRQIGLENI